MDLDDLGLSDEDESTDFEMFNPQRVKISSTEVDSGLYLLVRTPRSVMWEDVVFYRHKFVLESQSKARGMYPFQDEFRDL